MGSFLRPGYRPLGTLNPPWFTGRVSLRFGPMDLDVIVATRIIGGVVLATTPTQVSVYCALPGLRQSVYRAELHAIARALEECSPHEVVSDCKGAVKA
eukprot:6486879-Amphidinium_carterae.1